MMTEQTMSRRSALRLLTASLSSSVLLPARAAETGEPPKRTGLGLVIYCCRLRRAQLKKKSPAVSLFEPAQFLEHCRQVGAGGMQVPLGVLEASTARSLRNRAEAAKLYIEGIIKPPKDKTDVERFETEMKTAATVGAKAVRTTIIPGRRYEFFDSQTKFREYDARGRKSLELAAPVAEKYRVPLAVENHKDHRNDERVALLKHISSDFVGACVDTGNSFALLEDPIKTVEALAPWAHSVHLKDQAVQLYEDGFLLDDVPLGQGFLDLKKMVEILRRSRPDIRFSLELITRDPLKVPVLTEEYWATFPDVLGTDLARTLRAVRDGAANQLQNVSSLSPVDQAALEDANVRASLDYARDNLGI